MRPHLLRNPRRLITAAMVAGAALLCSATLASRADAWYPGSSCAWDGTGDGIYNCTSNPFKISAEGWSDIDLNCVDAQDKDVAMSIKLHTSGAGKVYSYGPYDNGDADGGHFWMRENNAWVYAKTMYFTYQCVS